MLWCCQFVFFLACWPCWNPISYEEHGASYLRQSKSNMAWAIDMPWKATGLDNYLSVCQASTPLYNSSMTSSGWTSQARFCCGSAASDHGLLSVWTSKNDLEGHLPLFCQRKHLYCLEVCCSYVQALTLNQQREAFYPMRQCLLKNILVLFFILLLLAIPSKPFSLKHIRTSRYNRSSSNRVFLHEVMRERVCTWHD